MELSKNQIAQLFAFVKSKYVRYIDVQYELVDHLASDIEVQMSQDPKLDFDSALHRVYSKFPITGFAQFILAKEEGLIKYWRKHILKYIIVNA